MNTTHGIYKISSLGRPLDPRYRSNLIAILGSLTVAIGFGAYNAMADTPLASSWTEAGVGVFLAWAIGRELDPDHPSSATMAMIASSGIALVAAPSLLTGAAVLVAARLITGSVASELRFLDPLALVGLGVMAGSGATSPAAVPALVVGIVVFGNRSLRSVVVAAATGVGAVVALIVKQPLLGSTDPEGWSIVFLIAAVVTLAVSIPALPPASLTDVDSKPLLGWRISASRVAVASTIGAAFALGGGDGINDIYATGGAALIGVALGQTLQKTRRRRTGVTGSDPR